MRDSDSIEEIANNYLNSLLFDLFDENNLKLIKSEAGRREVGIDFFYQVLDRESTKQVSFFDIQNKGTNKPVRIISQKNHTEKGKIGFSLELRHVNQYFYELTEPLLFILCDINNKTAYWYSIQLDRSIPEIIKKKEIELLAQNTEPKRPKLQIYIPSENIINSENFRRLLGDIELSREEQRRKSNTNLISEADFSKIEEDIRGKHIIDQAYEVIECFKGISVFPTRLINKLPFLNKSKYGARLDGFSLTTDNNDFFELIENIKLFDKKLIYSDGQQVVDNQEDKIKSIIGFLKSNYIRHLQWGGRKPKGHLCVHDLYIYKSCNCARCNFDDLDFSESKDQIQKGLVDESLTLFEQLRNGYASYLLGDLKYATEIHNRIYDVANREDNLVIISICKYNLKHIKRIVENNYFENDREQLLESIKFDDLSNDEGIIRLKAPFFLDIFYSLRDDKFYRTATWEIDGLVDESKKMFFFDKHGTSYSHKKRENIVVSFLRFYSFLEYNFIIFDYYTDYNRLATKFLECVFALYNIVNPESSKFENINLIVIRMWLFYVPPAKAKNLLQFYDITKIKLSEEDKVLDTLEELSINLFKSAGIVKDSRAVSYFHSKIKRIISNFFLISSRLNECPERINKIISNLLNVLNRIDRVNLTPFDSINQVLHYREDISKENIISIIDLCTKYENRGGNCFSIAMKHFVENSDSQEIEDFIVEFLGATNIEEGILFMDEKKIGNISYALASLNKETRSKIKEILVLRLQENFSSRLYDISTVFDLIDFDPLLFLKFVDTVPYQSKDEEMRRFYGVYDNFRLNQVINIIFKNELPITNDIKGLVDRASQRYREYYSWLLDIDGFDYTKFEPLWILEHQTKYYIERFKKSGKLKSEVQESLKRQYIEGVAQFYINHLV